MNELTNDAPLLTQAYLDELWAQPHDEVEDALLHHIAVMQQREARLRGALTEASDYIRNRHNMGRGQREGKRLAILWNSDAALKSCEYSGVENNSK